MSLLCFPSPSPLQAPPINSFCDPSPLGAGGVVSFYQPMPKRIQGFLADMGGCWGFRGWVGRGVGVVCGLVRKRTGGLYWCKKKRYVLDKECERTILQKRSNRHVTKTRRKYFFYSKQRNPRWHLRFAKCPPRGGGTHRICTFKGPALKGFRGILVQPPSSQV